MHVELGDELETVSPDVSLEQVRKFVTSAQMSFARFTDHEAARAEGLPGALVPGIMSQALLSTMIHAWAPGAQIIKMDTVFRAPIVVDTKPTMSAAVTDVDEDNGTVELDLTITCETGETGLIGTALVRLP